MKTASIESLIANVVETLKSEKACILSGDYANLPRIAEKKLSHLSTLEQYIVNPKLHAEIAPFSAHIELVKNLARENERLLTAAKTAAASAKTRIENLADRAKTVGTYMESGAKLMTHDAAVTRCKTA